MENTIQSDLIRGHINTIILKALFDGDRYGYDIVREIEQKSSGQYKLKQPTLYSCLKRLEIQGFIRSYWGAKSNGGRRKYFTLTDMGRELFLKNQSEWEYSRTVIDKLISDREVDLNNARPLNDNEVSDEPIYDDESNSDIEDTFPETAAEESDFDSGIINGDSYSAFTDEHHREDITENDEETEYGETQNADEPISPPQSTETEIDSAYEQIAFSDTTAIMNELLRRQSDDEQDSSYANKLVSEKYVSDNTDSFMSAESYFKDFVDMREAESTTNDVSENENRKYANENAVEDYDYFSLQSSAPTDTESFADKAEKPESIFLNYHTSQVAPQSDSAIIEREYRNILGGILSDSFTETPRPAVNESQQTEEEQFTEDNYTENDYSENEAEGQQAEDNCEEDYYDEYEQEEPAYEEENQTAYTSDAAVNRKLNKLTGEVRELGDNVKIRTHNNLGSKEYNNTYYYYSNKLMIVHYGILFGIMMLEILFSAVLVNLIMHAGSKTDKWFYIVAGCISVAFPITAFVKNLTAPDNRKRINFSLRNSLIYRLIVMAQCFLIIYCINIIAGMPLAFSSKYLTTILMPALLCTNFPVSALVFNALFKSKKFAAEQ